MKFYCKNCGSVFEPNGWHEYDIKHEECPFCKVGKLVEPVPGHETPARYKARTGRPYPDEGLVFYRLVFGGEVGKWEVGGYAHTIGYCADEGIDDIVIADPPVPPAKDWRPE